MPKIEFTKDQKRKAMMFISVLLDRSIESKEGKDAFEAIDWDKTIDKGIEALLRMLEQDSFKLIEEINK